jgi:hypothetical protein
VTRCEPKAQRSRRQKKMASTSRSLLRDDDESADNDTSASQPPSRAPFLLLTTIALVLFALGASHAVRPPTFATPPPSGGRTSSAAASEANPSTQVEARTSSRHHRVTHAHGPQYGLRMDRTVHQRQPSGRPRETQQGEPHGEAPKSRAHRTAEELRSENIRESQEDPTSMFDMSTP